RPVQQPGTRGALHLLVDEGATDIQQFRVFNTGGAGGLAHAAGQAAIQVSLRFRRGLRTFHDLLHQVNTPARAVTLVTEQLIGWAGGSAETAMGTGAQDAIGLLGVGRLQQIVDDGCLHYRSGYRRPGLKMPAGSSDCFRRWCSLSSAAGSGWKRGVALPRQQLAWPPAAVTAARIVSASCVERSQRWAPPHSRV